MRKQSGEVNGPGHTASQWQSWILTLVCAVHPEPVTLTTKMYMEGIHALLAVHPVGEGGAHGKRSMDLLGAGKKEFLSYLTFLSLSLQERHLGPRCFCPGRRGGVPNQSRE